MFRRERPQKGRYRQFHQIGFEYFGSGTPLANAETILTMMSIFKTLHINDLTLKLNSIGCEKCRQNFKTELKESLKRLNLCDNCKRRIDANPMRVLDCKEEKKETFDAIPVITSFLCNECAEHFEKLKDLLHSSDVQFKEDNRLVRGLDYYTRTVFELVLVEDERFAVAAGGRYDGLVKFIGGPDTPAIGYAIGCERVIDLMKPIKYEEREGAFIVWTSEKLNGIAFKLLKDLRDNGFKVDIDTRCGSLKSQLRRADKLNARFVIIIGDEEYSRGNYSIKDLLKGEQKEIPLKDILIILQQEKV